MSDKSGSLVEEGKDFLFGPWEEPSQIVGAVLAPIIGPVVCLGLAGITALLVPICISVSIAALGAGAALTLVGNTVSLFRGKNSTDYQNTDGPQLTNLWETAASASFQLSLVAAYSSVSFFSVSVVALVCSALLIVVPPTLAVTKSPATAKKLFTQLNKESTQKPEGPDPLDASNLSNQ